MCFGSVVKKISPVSDELPANANANADKGRAGDPDILREVHKRCRDRCGDNLNSISPGRVIIAGVTLL